MRANISLTISTMKVITLKIQYPDEGVCNILGIMPLIIHFYWFSLIRSNSGLYLQLRTKQERKKAKSLMVNV